MCNLAHTKKIPFLEKLLLTGPSKQEITECSWGRATWCPRILIIAQSCGIHDYDVYESHVIVWWLSVSIVIHFINFVYKTWWRWMRPASSWQYMLWLLSMHKMA